jgi:peptide/nickel transport system permease protein
MTAYIIRRLLLLPVTLFAIILINFIILNLAPGEPSSRVNVGGTGEATHSVDSHQVVGDQQYLQFREHYGLTLPILFNTWPNLKEEDVKIALEQLSSLSSPQEEMSLQDAFALRTLWGDRARFVMPLLLREASNPQNSWEVRKIALSLMIRGGTRQGYVGSSLTDEEKAYNKEISRDNAFLNSLRISDNDSPEEAEAKIKKLQQWGQSKEWMQRELRTSQKVRIFFLETRFARYFKRIVTLDFGTLRNDHNKTVISEVTKRLKYSLTLAVIPMLFTFLFCQLFGIYMATHQNQLPDLLLTFLFLVLFAIPVFVVAPFLIEKIALHHHIPFTNISIPYSGFSSPSEIYQNLTSFQRLGDISLHIFLPLVAIMYGTLALQSRISRTAVLEVLRQDYVRTAKAKGLPHRTVLFKHVGRNAAVTIITALAASLGVVLGGSLIVETVFEINGFGRFFYESIVNRDYNVVLFSAFAGSLLTLIGYLVADITYTLLDPRISFD